MQHRTEAVVIAAYLVNRSMDFRMANVDTRHFDHPRHRKWWATAMSLGDSYMPAKLDADPELLRKYAALEYTTDDVHRCEKEILDAWRLRAAKAVFSALAKTEYGSIEEMLRDSRAKLDEIEAGGFPCSSQHKSVVVSLLRDWSEGIASKDGVILPMPIEALDRKTGGWRRGKLYLVAAVTSGHKTTFARSAAWRVACAGHRVVFWTMEDSAEDVAARTLASEIEGIDTRTFTTYRDVQLPGGKEAMLSKLTRHMKNPGSVNMYYVDEPNPTIERVLQRISTEAAHGAVMVVLDFLQLIAHTRREFTDAQHWFDVTTKLAAAAKRLNVTILATVQPTQEATKEYYKTGKPITLGDLRGGSAIAQAAYGVMLLNRPIENGIPSSKVIEIDIAKWKNGATGIVTVNIERHRDRIYEASERPSE